MRLFPRCEGMPSRAHAYRNLAPSHVSDDHIATLSAAPSASLRCPFCQCRTALDHNQPPGARGLRSGDLVVCAECLAPTIVRRTKRSLLPRLTAPGAAM